MTKQFTAYYVVTIGDINSGGHLGNDKALVIFQDGRIRFFKSLGLSEKNIGEGKGIIIVESAVKYHREVFLHDELTISIGVAEVVEKKVTLEYCVTRQSDNEEVLSGSSVFLAFDYQSRKVVNVPDDFVDKIKRFTLEKTSLTTDI